MSGTCRVCGCTETIACAMLNGAPCWWVDDDLCSACSERLDDPAIEEIVAERIRQDLQWGGPEHDDGHEAVDWEIILRKHVQRLTRSSAAEPTSDYRDRLIKIAAIALAAAQSHDRKAKGGAS